MRHNCTMAITQRIRDQLRRETVERYHRLKDAEEDFDQAKANATSTEERNQLSADLARFRQQHREEDILRGKREPGITIRMHQIMWARWIEVAATHEAAALEAFDAICSGDTEQLLVEFRNSLVAFAAAASTIEALYEDVKYLIPAKPRKDSAAETICGGIAESLGLSAKQSQDFLDECTWLFERRNDGLHTYSEPETSQEHPSGVHTGAEMARFNGPESRRALHIALTALRFAEEPPAPANRWVTRWTTERKPYHESVVAPIRAQVKGQIHDTFKSRPASPRGDA